MMMLLFAASLSWHELAYATPVGFEPAPLQEVSISVLLDDIGKEQRTIYLRINKDGKLSHVCIDKVCNNILSSFQIARKIHDIYAYNLTVLKGVQNANEGWIRLILRFKAEENKKCNNKFSNGEEGAVALTFDQFGKIRSISVVCGSDGLYYENIK